jgi:hypothetical protein
MVGRRIDRKIGSRHLAARGLGLALAGALLALLVAAPAAAADMSDTEWEGLVRSKVVVRGVGHNVRYGPDQVAFYPSAEETERPRGTFEFERLPLEGGWIGLRGRYFTGRIAHEEVAEAIVAKVNEHLEVDDAELVALRSTHVKGVLGRERDRVRIAVNIRARVAVPSMGIEGRLVIIRLRFRGELVTGEPDPGEPAS